MTNDIIYLSSDLSTWDNEELRYSLRSIEKYFPNHGRVFLYGYKPAFINDSMPFVEVSDPYINKSKNIAEKIKKACENDDLTEDILVVADDIFFNDNVKWDWFKVQYYYGSIDGAIARAGNYKYYLEKTKETLDFICGAWKQKDYKNFDCHMPILINRRNFLDMMKHVKFLYEGAGPTVKTTYVYYCYPTHKYVGTPIYYNPKVTIQQLAKNLGTIVPIFSTGEDFHGDIAHAIMEAKYPDKSQWEVYAAAPSMMFCAICRRH